MGTSLVYSASASAGGERIHAMYAQTFAWPAGTYQATVTGDDAGTKTFSFGGLYFRVYLAQSTNDGTTELGAMEILAAVQTALGSSWEVNLRTDGYVQITNAGTTTGSITWSTATYVRDVLGFTGSSVSINANESAIASYPPLGVVYSVSLDSTDWTATPTDTAYAMLASGIAYGEQGGAEVITKTVTLGHHPRTWEDRVALGSPLTPMWPADTSYLRRRGFTSVIGATLPWSAHEFLVTARGLPIAAVFSNFQLFGPGRVYELGYQTPESISQARAITPAIKDYRQRSHRASFELSLHQAYELA